MWAQNAAPAAQSPTPAAATPATAAAPTGIAGIWQGTLHIEQANKDLRIEIKIAKDDKGGYKTTFYSVDQGGQALAATKTAFENGTLTFSLDLIGGKYEGKMSADGKSIAGTWTQGPASLALNLERTTPDAAWPIPEPIKPMAADANPGFDVATIKPSQPGRPGKIITIRGRSVVTMNTNLNDLLGFAYGVHTKQIIGAPEWAGSYLFDIDGVPDVPGMPNMKQMGLLFQKLLADRFQLKFHHEQRELSVYILTVTPGGPKMAKTTAGPNDPPGFLFRGIGDLMVRNMDLTGICNLDAVKRDGQARGGPHGTDREIRLHAQVDAGRLAVPAVPRGCESAATAGGRQSQCAAQPLHRGHGATGAEDRGRQSDGRCDRDRPRGKTLGELEARVRFQGSGISKQKKQKKI